ncbi:hypothetical protein, partial [Streptomyces sp. SID3343]|uniref:hypothetical protein n=1 Tax=Streptomyces sp. SID3343 TaxID=2690260 RepID=UPI0013712F34
RYAAGFGPEDHALLDYVQRLHDVTSDPDSADHPDDEPDITRLLAVGECSTRTMARILNAASAAAPRPALRLVPDRTGG